MDTEEAFDPTRFTLPDGAVGKAAPRSRPPRRQAKRKFLRGPIPWPWLAKAAKLPGKALHVAMVLWHLKGITNRYVVHWEPARAKSLGLTRQAVYHGLAALEAAGLVAVDRKRGRGAVVTILVCPDPEETTP